MHKHEEENQEQEKTIREELRGHIARAYNRVEEWMRPSKDQPWPLQVVLFILKLPLLLLLLLLSPVLLVVLLFVFFAAL